MPKKDVLAQEASEKKRRLVTLTLTQDCNLRCRYCYEPVKSRDYHMTLEVAQEAITYFMEGEEGTSIVEIGFFGGEPMLAFEVIRDTVEWFHSRDWPKEHLFSIGTNGTILTDQMKTWLVKHKRCVKVGVSLDGNKVAHDLNRGKSYDRVIRNLPFFREHWPEQPVKMTISAESLPYVADSIIDLEEKGIPFTANIVFENIWGTAEQKAILLDIYAGQLDRLVGYYLDRPHLVPARILDVKPEFLGEGVRIVAGTADDCVRWCGSGHEMVVVEVDGSRSPCHRFSPWVTGRPLPISPVNHQTAWKPEECGTCRLINVCPTCAGFNWQENGDSSVCTRYHCEAFKLEALASAKLKGLRYLRQNTKDLTSLPLAETYKMKQQLDGILFLASTR